MREIDYGAERTYARRTEAYFPEIDGLRAVAVLSVILYHLHEPFLPGGFIGVDIFFVISGYVVSMSLARDVESPFLLFLRRFYARRIRRIVPALLVCLLVTTAATVLFIPKAWLSATTQRTGLAAFFGMSNFVLAAADPYFSPRPAFNPFTHTWSLAVEEQFYLFYPMILFISLRFGPRRGIMGIAATILLPLLLLSSFLALWRISGTNREAAFYLLPYRFWELGAGALCFMVQRGREPRLSVLGRFVTWTGGALILATIRYADPGASPFPWSLPAVVGSILVIAALTTQDAPATVIAMLLRSRPFVFIGQLSYSLYLWHWPVFVLFRWTFGLHDPPYMAAAVVLTFALAFASYVAVEQPIRGGRWLRAQPEWAVLTLGMVSVGLFWGVANYAYASQNQLSLSVVMRNASDWYPDPPQHRVRASSCDLEWRGGKPDNVLTLYRPCGTPAWERRMFVIGDSHAAAYSQMLLMLAEQEHVDVRIYLQAGCSYANMLDPATPNCQSFVRSATQSVLRDARPGDTVFLASLRMPRVSDQFTESAASIDELIASQASPGAVEVRNEAYDEAAGIVKQFAARALKIVIDAPKPVFKAAPFRCADWFDRDNPMCRTGLEVPRDELLALRQPIMASLARLSAAYSAVAVWDPFPVLCGTAACRAITASGPLFFDGDHLSNVGNRLLYPDFVSFLRRMWFGTESESG